MSEKLSIKNQKQKRLYPMKLIKNQRSILDSFAKNIEERIKFYDSIIMKLMTNKIY